MDYDIDNWDGIKVPQMEALGGRVYSCDRRILCVRVGRLRDNR